MGEVRFMISEAAKQVHVESHVLRYWEDELGLTIGRTEMGHRYYTQDDIKLFCCIKKLKDEGLLLKDLKPLIPELTQTKNRLKTPETQKEDLQDATPPQDMHPAQPSGDTYAAPDIKDTSPEVVIPLRQLDQVRTLISDVVSVTVSEAVTGAITDTVSEVITENNHTLTEEITSAVTSDVMREMDFLMQARERQQEEHFRRLDSLIRQQQASRKESSKTSAVIRLKNIFT